LALGQETINLSPGRHKPLGCKDHSVLALVTFTDLSTKPPKSISNAPARPRLAYDSLGPVKGNVLSVLVRMENDDDVVASSVVVGSNTVVVTATVVVVASNIVVVGASVLEVVLGMVVVVDDNTSV
jgi:hypothetical protein